MHRRDFLTKSCTACLSLTAMASVVSSCQATHYIGGTMGQDGLTIALDDFKTVSKDKNSAYRSFLIIRNDALQYPICVYRFSNTEYSALWMRCSHQGSELQASGDFLQCPAHGSEFNNKGKVTNGPADNNLRTFPVTVNNNELFIDLRRS